MQGSISGRGGGRSHGCGISRLEFRFLPATGQLDDLGNLPIPSELLHSHLEKGSYQVGFMRNGVWSLVRNRLLKTRVSIVILVRSTNIEHLVTLSA